MPLTKAGKKVKRAMMKHYGKARGARIFFMSENKGVAGSRKWARKKRKH